MTRLAIIAGQGNLPLQVARAADEQGLDVVIFPIEGQADAVFDDFVVQPVRLGAIGQTQGFLKHHDCRQMVMVGKVVWPSLGALRPDAAGMKLLGKLIKRGDDSVLRVISQFFAEHGVKTLPVNMFLDGRAMPSGHVAGPSVDEHGESLIEIGVSILDKLGACDVGQSVIVQNGRVLAIEAAEGTSAMLARSADLIDSDAGPAVFVKMLKSGQDHRLDTPFVGAETMRAAAAAGINILAIESGAVMLADDLQKLADICTEYGMSFVGISATAGT
ncbi:MAG: LpxI family protein [Candidatus Puniceispirillaceae bacterium]|jgi:DUF1009 family protein